MENIIVFVSLTYCMYKRVATLRVERRNSFRKFRGRFSLLFQKVTVDIKRRKIASPAREEVDMIVWYHITPTIPSFFVIDVDSTRYDYLPYHTRCCSLIITHITMKQYLSLEESDSA